MIKRKTMIIEIAHPLLSILTEIFQTREIYY